MHLGAAASRDYCAQQDRLCAMPRDSRRAPPRPLTSWWRHAVAPSNPWQAQHELVRRILPLLLLPLG
eukprot:3909741-Pleurochrysis_carterae.AAC.3